MTDFGDGREERLDALEFESDLRARRESLPAAGRSRVPCHTPGPWNVELMVGLPRVFSGSRVIADLHIQEGIGALQGGKNPELRDEIAANARLIAAAPEMLEALKSVLTVGVDIDLTQKKNREKFDTAIRDAWSAIRKAEGKS